MRKIFLAATILAPFAVAPAFADGGAVAGSLTGTGSMSVAGVSAGQSTQAGALTVGNGASFQSATAGNNASIATDGYAKAGPGYSATGAKTTQSQGGGSTVVSKSDKGWGGLAGGGATASEGSNVVGGSVAGAGNVNGFVATVHTR